jgi:diguanylate cyclase (GGDEF)-like protein
MIVAPGNDLHDASILCERIRKVIENLEIRWAGQDLRVSISLGAATWPVVPAAVVNEIISAADEALYFAKESGRNRVAIHQGDDLKLFGTQA